MSIPDAITGLTKFLKALFVLYFLNSRWAAFVNNFILIFIPIRYQFRILSWFICKKLLRFPVDTIELFIRLLIFIFINLLWCRLGKIQSIHARARGLTAATNVIHLKIIYY